MAASGISIREIQKNLGEEKIALRDSFWIERDFKELSEKLKKVEIVQRDKQGNCVLLTGATGFLGCHVLAELLKSNKASKIFCIVRGKDEQDSLNRVLQVLRKHKILGEVESSLKGKVRVLCGDLTKERFGLEQTEFEELECKVCFVFHCAANVNHLLSYDYLRRANVLPTFELISFCKKNRAKINYVSSISVVDGKRGLDEKYDTFELDSLQVEATGGYVASKIVCERILHKSTDVKYTIFRAGMISWNRYGVSNSFDWFHKLFSGIFHTRIAPSLKQDVEFNLIPVDFCSSVLVHVGSSQMSDFKIFHLINNNKNITLNRIIELAENYLPQGVELTSIQQEKLKSVWKFTRVPLHEWQSYISTKISQECEQRKTNKSKEKNKVIMELEYFVKGPFPDDSKDKTSCCSSFEFFKEFKDKIDSGEQFSAKCESSEKSIYPFLDSMLRDEFEELI